MSILRSVGVAAGILVGIIICVIIFKAVNTNHKVITKYDERQQVIRGKGYRFAFYAVLGFEALMSVLSIGEIPALFPPAIIHFIAIIFGCAVLCIYCIWHDVYWGLNNDPKRYSVIFLILGVINAVPVVLEIIRGEFYKNGQFSATAANLAALILIIVIGVELLIKKTVNKTAVEEE